MKDFQIPSYRERFSPRNNISILDGNICEDVEPGPCFENLPMDRKLTEKELDTFRNIVKTKKKNKANMFLEPGLGRKIRLSNEYVDTNLMIFTSKGTRCILCYSILKQEQQSTTTKGCATCCVPLCSSTNTKFINPNDSCEYWWHKFMDLKALEPPLVKKRGITGLVRGAVQSLMSLADDKNVKKKRKRRR